MKRINILSIIIIILALYQSSKAQIFNVEIIVDEDSVPRYQSNLRNKNQIRLKMNYGSYLINNPWMVRRLKNNAIRKISLIYTDFPKDMDLVMLTKKRLASLYLLLPEVFDNPLIEWEFIRQTACKNLSQAQSMYHGYVISYAPAPSRSSVKKETEYMRDVLEGKEELKDSTILNVLERNENWNNLLVVADLTGSMSPYAVQLLVWLKLTIKNKRAKYFVFFNDGDAKMSSEKKIGKTGGIYSVEGNSLDTVFNKMIEVMQNGFGGDLPENNMEAILYGINKYDNYDGIVLIADNIATPRDIELTSEINKPVKIILCGAFNKINPVYLDIARKTRGSVHTMEEDILDLMKLNEGEEITINNQTFKIVDGKFVAVF